MRKYLLIICCVVWSVTAVAQTYQRSNKGPNFFMPTGAMDNSAQRQRQNQPQRQNQTQPRVQQQYQAQQQRNKLRVQQAQSKTQTGQQLRQQKVQQPVRKTETVPQKANVSQPKKSTTTVSSSTVKKPVKVAVPVKEQKTIAIKQKNIGHLMGMKTVPEKPAVKTEEIETPEPKTLLVQIIEDYEKDLKLIGQKQKVRNIRLQKVLSSFQDKDIEF